VKRTLRTKILIVLLIVLSLLGGTAYLIHSQVMLPSFLDLERQHISANVRRVVKALENEQHHLSLLANDWSAWDDTYQYAIDHNQEYEVSNLVGSTLAINELNLLYILDSDRRTLWGSAVDEDFETPLTLQQFDREIFPVEFPLLEYRTEQGPLNERQTKGLIMTSAGPMLCVARPILNSNDQGPAHGTLIMGRLLGQEMTRKISHLTGVSYDVKILPTGATTDHVRSDDHEISLITYLASDNTITASTRLVGLDDTSTIEITVYEERLILKQGLRALRIALTLLAIGATVALALMLLMLQRSVLTPVNRLTRFILDRRHSKQQTADLDMGTCTSQEICLLSDEFKQLLKALDTKNTQLGEVNFILIEEAKKLKQAETTLKNLDQLKSEFISTAAHELSTPVASIMGFTELLSDPEMLEPFSEEQRQDFLKEIYENSERLAKIVDDILDVSRIEAGRSIPLDKRPESITDLLERSIKRFGLMSGQKIVLEVKPETPETLEIDGHRINQVMENLISNAIKYSSEESRISIVTEQDGRHCKVTVIDQGIGMTDEQKNRIFDKFYRADASDTAIRGLGLGMSIVKQIIEDHNGAIWVDSTPEEGTRVYFTLPTSLPG
jgi:signal transduction histidine kinase